MAAQFAFLGFQGSSVAGFSVQVLGLWVDVRSGSGGSRATFPLLVTECKP